MYSKNRKRNYKQLNIHNVDDNIYRIISILSVLRNISLNQVIVSLLNHSYQPKYVPETSTLALQLKSYVDQITESLGAKGQQFNQLDHLLHLYWNAKQLKSPNEFNSYQLLLSDLHQSVHHLNFMSQLYSNWSHYFLFQYGLITSLHNSVRKKHISQVSILATSLADAPVKPLHHLSLRVPISLYVYLHNTCTKHHTSYAKFLYTSVALLPQIPTVIDSLKQNSTTAFIVSCLKILQINLNKTYQQFNHILVTFASQFFNRPKAVQTDNSQILGKIEQLWHHSNVLYIHPQSQLMKDLYNTKRKM